MKKFLIVAAAVFTASFNHSSVAAVDDCSAEAADAARAWNQAMWAQQNLPVSQLGPYLAAWNDAVDRWEMCVENGPMF